MVKEDYVSFETAKLLKEKGFDWVCHATYDTAVTGGKPKFSEYEVLSYFPYGMKNTDDKYSMIISAPTIQLAMKWLREVHNIHIVVHPYTDEEGQNWSFIFDKYTYGCWQELGIYITDSWSSYEEACEVAIKYCLDKLI